MCVYYYYYYYYYNVLLLLLFMPGRGEGQQNRCGRPQVQEDEFFFYQPHPFILGGESHLLPSTPHMAAFLLA